MIIKSQLLETPIIYKNGKINVIEIEEVNIFRRLVNSFHQYLKDGESEEKLLILNKNNQKLDIQQNCLLTLDYYNIDFQSAIITKQILKKLENEVYLNDGLQQMIMEINHHLETFSHQLLLSIDLDLLSKKLEIKDYLKLLSFKINSTLYKSPYEYIILLIKICSDLSLYDLLIFVDLKKFCSISQIEEIYKSALYHGINILLIESKLEDKLLEYEQKLVIESDFTEFFISNKEEIYK